ncbi:hypothetical protein C8J57DRAFT_1479425 [Mycena rebaudengoi]|nr:hypothetical protein C8J57DRAFT_1479425 [Mycena rebaudengoi]
MDGRGSAAAGPSAVRRRRYVIENVSGSPIFHLPHPTAEHKANVDEYVFRNLGGSPTFYIGGEKKEAAECAAVGAIRVENTTNPKIEENEENIKQEFTEEMPVGLVKKRKRPPTDKDTGMFEDNAMKNSHGVGRKVLKRQRAASQEAHASRERPVSKSQTVIARRVEHVKPESDSASEKSQSDSDSDSKEGILPKNLCKRSRSPSPVALPSLIMPPSAGFTAKKVTSGGTKFISWQHAPGGTLELTPAERSWLTAQSQDPRFISTAPRFKPLHWTALSYEMYCEAMRRQSPTTFRPLFREVLGQMWDSRHWRPLGQDEMFPIFDETLKWNYWIDTAAGKEHQRRQEELRRMYNK